MLKVLSAIVLLLLTTAGSAQEWQFEDLGVPIAYLDNGRAQLQFACRGGDLAFGFWVRAPHPQVAAAKVMSLVISPDPAAATAGSVPAGSSFAEDLPLIHNDGTSMVIRGPVARQWATLAQRAREVIHVAYLEAGSGGRHEVFDSNLFGAGGSAAAIGKVLDRCG